MQSWTLLVLFSCWWNAKNVACIDCFRCKSFDNQNPICDDPFEGTTYKLNNKSESILETNCYTGKRGRIGLFPATSCIKLSGTFRDSGKTLVVRDCALDSGGLNADTELVRIKSQCGAFYLDNKYIEGCVQSCNTDACNSSESIHRSGQLASSFIFYMTSIFQFAFAAFQLRNQTR